MDMDFHGLSLNLRGRQILDGVSGAFRQGQVTVILGANGAGKSSLLSCLAGLRTPDRGQIKLGGRSLAVFDRRGRARMIGLLSQRADIHWDVAVPPLVGLGRLPHRGRGGMRSDGRRVGKECVSTCRSRWTPYNYNKNTRKRQARQV